MKWLVLLAGGVLLQIFLSRRRSRWLGLVLPGLTFLYPILMVLSVAVYLFVMACGVRRMNGLEA